jgi:Domain of unknown function (DUF397)
MSAHGARQTGQPTWRGSSYRQVLECVEVRQRSNMTVLRDSPEPHGQVLRYTAGNGNRSSEASRLVYSIISEQIKA